MSPTTLQGMTSHVSRVAVLLYGYKCHCAHSSLVYDTCATVLTNLELRGRCSPYFLLALGYDDSAPAIVVQYVL